MNLLNDNKVLNTFKRGMLLQMKMKWRKAFSEQENRDLFCKKHRDGKKTVWNALSVS